MFHMNQKRTERPKTYLKRQFLIYLFQMRRARFLFNFSTFGNTLFRRGIMNSISSDLRVSGAERKLLGNFDSKLGSIYKKYQDSVEVSPKEKLESVCAFLKPDKINDQPKARSKDELDKMVLLLMRKDKKEPCFPSQPQLKILKLYLDQVTMTNGSIHKKLLDFIKSLGDDQLDGKMKSLEEKSKTENGVKVIDQKPEPKTPADLGSTSRHIMQFAKIKDEDINKNLGRGNPLSIACGCNCPDSMRYLIGRGAAKSISQKMLFSCLEPKKRECLDILLDNGANVEWLNSDEKSLLDVTIESRFLNDTAKYLVESKGADVNGAGRYSSPLTTAITERNIDMVKFLLEKGAENNVVGRTHYSYKKRCFCNPLGLAINNKILEKRSNISDFPSAQIVKLLREKGFTDGYYEYEDHKHNVRTSKWS